MGRGSAIGDVFARLFIALGLYAVLAGGAFVALGALWPPNSHTPLADGQTGMGTSLLGAAALLLGALLLALGATLPRVTGRRTLRWVALVAVLCAALAAGLVVIAGVNAMDGRAVGSLVLMGGIAGVLALSAPSGRATRRPV